jgi:carbonic anhydrase
VNDAAQLNVQKTIHSLLEGTILQTSKNKNEVEVVGAIYNLQA